MIDDGPKTTDYCAQCGESPDSGTHLFDHTYIPPTELRSGDFTCVTCGARLGTRAAAMAHLRLNILHMVRGLFPGGSTVASALPHLGRVKCEDRPGMPQFGVFVGLMVDDGGESQVVVRLDHYGLMLKCYHPSKVTPVTADEEEAHK